jgi:hypothetical protein
MAFNALETNSIRETIGTSDVESMKYFNSSPPAALLLTETRPHPHGKRLGGIEGSGAPHAVSRRDRGEQRS